MRHHHPNHGGANRRERRLFINVPMDVVRVTECDWIALVSAAKRVFASFVPDFAIFVE